jgi:hypothetical protein
MIPLVILFEGSLLLARIVGPPEDLADPGEELEPTGDVPPPPPGEPA